MLAARWHIARHVCSYSHNWRRRVMSTAAKRSYADAINALNTLQSNAQVIEEIRKRGGKGGEAQIVESLEYLDRMGYKPEDLNALNAIHITGTKGKGSTSAFTDSMLRSLAPKAKVGLYTSPHLVAVRERIRINGQPISEEMFAKYFFEVWDKMEQNTKRANPDTTPEKPVYFRYLTMMAFHVFLSERVDATVLEVGIGGTFDSTNIVPQTLVTGVSPLGIDHVFVLGRTLPEIAHQKGGIYKPGVPALAIQQPSEGLDVLRSRATELKASSFTVVPEHKDVRDIELGLAGDHQRSNASLAIALVQTFLASPKLPAAFASLSLRSSASESSASSSASSPPSLPLDLVSPSPLPSPIVRGLERTRWPGRCQTAIDSERTDLTWFLDGAHTVESLECCGTWFAKAAMSDSKSATRVLVFNCTSGRSGQSLLSALLSRLPESAAPFRHVVFCTNTTFASGASKGDLTSKAVDAADLAALATQHQLAQAWKSLPEEQCRSASVHVLLSIEDAVKLARGVDGKVDVLVTGSLHLIGGLMAVADVGLE